MDLICPSCTFATTVPDAQLPPEGTRARCPSCARVSIFLRGGLVDDDPTPPQPLDAVKAPAPTPAWPPGAPIGATPAWPPGAPIGATPAWPPGAPIAATPLPGTLGAAKLAGPWHFKTVAGDEGPYDGETVKNLVRTHSLHPDDQALPPGETEWRRAGDVPALAKYFKIRQATPLPSSPGPASCFKHPAKPGGWLCTGCGTLSCGDCAVEQVLNRVKVKVCPRCSKPVTEFKPSKVVVPFWKEIPQVLAFPVKGMGWLAILVCAVIGAMAEVARHSPMYGTVAWAILTLPIYAYHLFIIRSTSRGGRGLPHLGDVANFKNDMIIPGFKASIVSTLLFIGPTLYFWNYVGPAYADVARSQASLMIAIDGRDRAARGEEEPTAEEDEEEARTARDNQDTGQPTDDPKGEAFGALMDHIKDQSGGRATHDDPFREYRRKAPKTDWDEEVSNARRAVRNAKSSATTCSVIFGVLTMAALTLLPLMLIVVALFNTIAPIFQPQILFRIIGEIQQEYAVCAVITLGLFFLASAVSVPIIVASKGFFGAQSNPLAYFFTFMAFYVMGRTAEMAEQKLDWY